ncbi:uncharacterized protein LOC120354571 [Nilaparvata lugens]|uniref:uncharacterized protein LOC120354571 n=1 Tax=Nilaparvata lugens TaxID=108931 RepID=UPI00193CA9F6|nr:uncharacterized protein LOC120354571 [Nilaparvata lugens]
MDKSHRASSSSFLLPDSPPPERELNFWEQQKQQKKQQKSLSSAATSAATAVASTSGAPSSSSASDPLKKQGIFVQDEDSSIIVGDSSPLPQATWAPRRAALTSVPAPKQSVKRRLFVDDDDEEPGVLTQSKKRAVEEDEEDSSIMTLLQQEEDEILPEEHFLTVINRYAPKPWTPLRELMEGTPYPIEDVREVCNQHGHRVLKIRLSGKRMEQQTVIEKIKRLCADSRLGHITTSSPRQCTAELSPQHGNGGGRAHISGRQQCLSSVVLLRSDI